MDKEKYLERKYCNKKCSTKHRIDKAGNPIEFRLSLDEWCSLWNDAGLLPSRTNVLSRKNDLGHYEIGNVYVNHNLHNVVESMTDNSELEQRITKYSIKTGYKRRIIKGMIARGELDLSKI